MKQKTLIIRKIQRRCIYSDKKSKKAKGKTPYQPTGTCQYCACKPTIHKQIRKP